MRALSRENLHIGARKPALDAPLPIPAQTQRITVWRLAIPVLRIGSAAYCPAIHRSRRSCASESRNCFGGCFIHTAEIS